MKPLHGLRVIDFTQAMAAPFCTMNLADMGADVIKLEPPGEGEPTRHLGAVHKRDDAGVGHQVLAVAGVAPGLRFSVVCGHQAISSAIGMTRWAARAGAGRGWPRSCTNWMSGSPWLSLTKVRKRLSFSGSLRALAHSHS